MVKKWLLPKKTWTLKKVSIYKDKVSIYKVSIKGKYIIFHVLTCYFFHDYILLIQNSKILSQNLQNEIKFKI